MIAINDAYKLAPWAGVLYAADSLWWRVHQGVPSFTGLKYSLQPEARRWPGVEVLRNTGEFGLETDPTGLRTGRNSGYQAINVAVHLGALRIVLLGYDMQATEGKSHWFGDHPKPLRHGHTYGVWLTFFRSLVQPLADLGVTVINATRTTALETFPRMSLAEALA